MRNRWTSTNLIGGSIMASIPLSESALASLKKSLRSDYPAVRSSHLTEAIAAALGRKSHAALLADMAKLNGNLEFALLEDELFDKRLQEFGYPSDIEFNFEMFVDSIPGIISTMPLSAFDIKYGTARESAWRNLMVCAINAGLYQKLFTLNPDNYSWAENEPKDVGRVKDGCLFDFVLPTGQPARGYVDDAGFGELTIHVAVNPTGSSIKAWNAGFSAGEAFAAGWLEREKGAWLQSATTQFNCRKSLLKILADMEVHPCGFGDRGRVIM
jgi:hypothetical protein